MFSTSEAHAKYKAGNPYGVVNLAEAFMTTLVHEITHMLFEKVSTGAFDKREHLTAAKYSSDVMYQPATKANRELATVTFHDVV